MCNELSRQRKPQKDRFRSGRIPGLLEELQGDQFGWMKGAKRRVWGGRCQRWGHTYSPHWLNVWLSVYSQHEELEVRMWWYLEGNTDKDTVIQSIHQVAGSVVQCFPMLRKNSVCFSKEDISQYVSVGVLYIITHLVSGRLSRLICVRELFSQFNTLSPVWQICHVHFCTQNRHMGWQMKFVSYL